MAKRTKIGSELLTGGTGDVNPQYMAGSLTLSAANTFTEVTQGTPIVRVGPQTGGQAIIMEVLKVFVNFPPIDLDAAGATPRTFTFTATTSSQGTAQFGLENGQTLVFLQKTIRNAFTAAGTGILDIGVDPLVYDMTDNAGHGVLVATDNLFLGGNTTNQTAASVFAWKILYRFKKVSLVEYIGIVQSQQ